MTIHDAILATIAEDSAGRSYLQGRTLLQKKLYFLSVLAGEDFGFVPHFYGPYSAQVAEDLSVLIGAGFVDEEVESRSTKQGRFSERRVYRYRGTDSLTEVLAENDEQIARYRLLLRRINDDPIANNTERLSVAAKVHLIVSRSGVTDPAEIKREANDLGWDLNEETIDAVADYLAKLRTA